MNGRRRASLDLKPRFEPPLLVGSYLDEVLRSLSRRSSARCVAWRQSASRRSAVATGHRHRARRRSCARQRNWTRLACGSAHSFLLDRARAQTSCSPSGVTSSAGSGRPAIPSSGKSRGAGSGPTGREPRPLANTRAAWAQSSWHGAPVRERTADFEAVARRCENFRRGNANVVELGSK